MKWIKRALWAFALLVCVALGVATWLWMRGIPRTEGELTVEDLTRRLALVGA